MRAAALATILLALPLAAQEPGFVLDVPAGLEDSVWSFCLERWGHEGGALPGLGAGFCADDAEEELIEDCFDDTKFTLLAKQAELLQRRWSKGSAQQKKRELLLLRSRAALGEWPVRPVEWHGDPEENVPGLQLISRGDRGALSALLKKLDVDGLDLLHALQLQRRVRSIHVTRHEKPWATLGLDAAVARKLWWRASFTRLALEPDPTAGPEERSAVAAAAPAIQAELLARFPDLRPDPTTTYARAFGALESRAISFRTSVVMGLPLFLVLACPIATAALIARAARRQAGLPSRRWR